MHVISELVCYRPILFCCGYVVSTVTAQYFSLYSLNLAVDRCDTCRIYIYMHATRCLFGRPYLVFFHSLLRFYDELVRGGTTYSLARIYSCGIDI